MGAILGGFGKMMAAKRLRNAQYRQMDIQRQLAHVNRAHHDQQRSIENQKKMMMNGLQAELQAMKMGSQVMMASQQSSIFADAFAGTNFKYDSIITKDNYKEFTYAKMGDDNKVQNVPFESFEAAQSALQACQLGAQQTWAKAQSGINTSSMFSEQLFAQQKSQMEQYFENMQDMMLEPLKDEEERLEQEKLALDSEIQLAQQDKEACEKMEQAGIKALVPSYTGQA